MKPIRLADALNPKQLEAADTVDGPVLIIAGAGSGKTRMMTYRIASLIANRSVLPENILALTFTNKAASEMAARIEKLVDLKPQSLQVSTFHAFGVRILRRHIHLLGYQPHFTIYDEADKLGAVKEAARESGVDLATVDCKAVADLFSKIKTEQASWTDANRLYLPLFETYGRLLRAYNAVDFDDLISLPIRLFTEGPSLLEHFQDQYRYIMVDEFQDTSLIQYRLLSLLAKKHRNVCVVGDDDQSIYSWRGANFQNILLFEADFPERKEIMLEQNYRSTGTILAAANHVIANNTDRKSKQLWTPAGKGGALEIFYPKDEYDEAKTIAELIASLRLNHRIPFKEFGILVRTNSLTDVIEEALLNANLPYRISGGSGFFQRKEIKDLIAYLKVMVNPDDEISLLRILNVPRRGIGIKGIEQIRRLSQETHCSFFAAVKTIARSFEGAPFSERLQRSCDELVQLIDTFSKKFEEKHALASKTLDLISEINFWGYLLTENPDNEKLAQFKYHNLTRFTEMMDRWEKNPDNPVPDLNRYLTRITLLTADDDNAESDRLGKVNLMTIHASKGLEFDTVFLAGMEDHILPHEKSIRENPDQLQEERRLFYVAITRAKRRLFLSVAQTRKRNHTVQPCLPSRFLEEIPSELVEPMEAAAMQAVTDENASFYFENIFASMAQNSKSN